MVESRTGVERDTTVPGQHNRKDDTVTETWGTEEIEMRTEPGVQTHSGHCTGELIHIRVIMENYVIMMSFLSIRSQGPVWRQSGCYLVIIRKQDKALHHYKEKPKTAMMQINIGQVFFLHFLLSGENMMCS